MSVCSSVLVGLRSDDASRALAAEFGTKMSPVPSLPW